MTRPEESPAPADDGMEGAPQPVDIEYPYNPSLLIYELRGIEKLRAMPDRVLAAQLYRNWKSVEARLKPRELYPRATAPAPRNQPATDQTKGDDWWDK